MFSFWRYSCSCLSFFFLLLLVFFFFFAVCMAAMQELLLLMQKKSPWLSPSSSWMLLLLQSSGKSCLFIFVVCLHWSNCCHSGGCHCCCRDSTRFHPCWSSQLAAHSAAQCQQIGLRWMPTGLLLKWKKEGPLLNASPLVKMFCFCLSFNRLLLSSQSFCCCDLWAGSDRGGGDCRAGLY